MTSNRNEKPILSIINTQNPLRLKAMVYWALAEVAHKPGIAIVQGHKNSIAAKLAKGAGLSCLYFVNEGFISEHGRWYWLQAQKLGYEPFLLSNKSIDICLKPKVQAGYENIGDKNLIIKKRTFASQYASLQPVSWMQLSGNTFMQTLKGAMEQLVNNKSILTIASEHLSKHKDELFVLLKANGFKLYDFLLNELKSSDLIENDLFALPASSNKIEYIINLLGHTQFISENKLDNKTIIKKRYMEITRYPSNNAKLISTYLFNQHLSLNWSELFQYGFYDREFDNDIGWSWTGRNKNATLIIPIPVPGQYHIRTGVFAFPADKKSDFVRIFANGVKAFAENVYEGNEIGFDVLVPKNLFRQSIHLVISVAEHCFIEGAEYGVALSNIDLYWQEDEFV
jgi:hypothetical protein